MELSGSANKIFLNMPAKRKHTEFDIRSTVEHQAKSADGEVTELHVTFTWPDGEESPCYVYKLNPCGKILKIERQFKTTPARLVVTIKEKVVHTNTIKANHHYSWVLTTEVIGTVDDRAELGERVSVQVLGYQKAGEHSGQEEEIPNDTGKTLALTG